MSNRHERAQSQNAGQRTVSLSNILLAFLLCVVLIIGLLPFCVLLGSGTQQSLERNSVDIVSSIVQNRQAVLQNAMVDQWSGIRDETDFLDANLDAFLDDNGLDAQQFIADDAAKRRFAANVFPEFLEYLRRDTSSGVFLVLTNAESPDVAQSYTGFFLRDSDPTTKTETDSDLLVERGDKGISQQAGISLDTSWAPQFSFAGNGQRACDDFFYKPYEAALAYPSVDTLALGCWSVPFVLEDHVMDNHRMITYSVPVVHNGVVVGVLGAEVSTSYLVNTYFSVSDLDKSENAGYVLAINKHDGTYEPVVGKGALYDAACAGGTASFALDETEFSELGRVRDAKVGSQGIMASVAPLSLYSSKVPYQDTDWVLVGFVSENYVYGMGGNLYNSIGAAVVICALVGMVLVAFVSRGIAYPVQRLVRSVAGGIAGLRAYRPTHVREVDELHRVMLNLTEDELAVEERLREEKERYRLAVESSTDVFFTYRMVTGGSDTFEVVNSVRNDGVWDAQRFFDEGLAPHMKPSDLAQLISVLRSNSDELFMQAEFTDEDSPAGRWLELRGTSVSDEQTGMRFVVGYIRNIDAAKRREIALQEKADRDPVTGFYRRERGIELIQAARQEAPDGVMVLIDLVRFNDIVRRFGITFGDVVLEELAQLMRDIPGTGSGDVVVRAGSDEVLAWVAGGRVPEAHARLEDLAARFSAIIRHGSIRLGFNAGVAPCAANVSTDELIRRVRVCVVEAREADRMIMDWHDVAHPNRQTRPFGAIESMGYASQLGLSSLALNLLDRRFSVSAALDLLMGRLRERFALDNLIITAFDEEYLSSTVRYCWKAPDGLDEATCVAHVSRAEFDSLQARAGSYTLRPLSQAAEVLPHLLPGACYTGVAFAMAENERYSGSIFLIGVSETVLDNDSDVTVLREICSIVQNRLAQEHLDQSAQAKSDFLARMSHEIRTPMNGIIGMTDIALEKGQSPERMRDCLEKVSSSSHYLLGLLNDILDMSKIESGKMDLVEAPFDVRETLQALHPVLDARFQSSEQRFEVDALISHAQVMGDELRLSQVLINLLGNANKYSPADTDITLRVRELGCDGGYVRLAFAVIDHGVGIDEADRKRIFGRFEQVDNLPSRRQGTGLGLSICNHLVRMMGSSIELESEVGVGSTFSFELTLPVASRVHEQRQPGKVRSDYSGMRALVAEDNELNQEILSYLLEELGFTVTCVDNGVQAVEAFENSMPGTFDVVIMDVMMPVMGGLEATHRIRGLARGDARTVPIIAASANAFDEDVNRSLAAGMNAHMSKPVDAQVLKETLASVIS